MREIIGDAPRKVNCLIKIIEDFVTKTMGKPWLDCAKQMVSTTRLSIMGLRQDEDENIAVIKINNHEDNFKKFVFEFQLRTMTDTSISAVAKALFEEDEFVPTNNTSVLLSVANMSPRITFERKHNNFILNLCDLDDEVERRNLKKGDKRYDILNEAIDSLINFNRKIKLRDGFLSESIDYSCY